VRAAYYEKIEGQRVHCLLCPHGCRIAEGRHGICRVRLNRRGDLSIPYYGQLTAVSVDPIEKKPLYHYHPGSSILSVGFLGCSFRCPFCQNYHISQTNQAPARSVNPEQLIDMTLESRSFGIAYTYSEPLIHYEYVRDASSLAREKGLKNVLVSNGYINAEPASDLLSLLDAISIDLKSFNPEFYKKEIGGSLEEVQRFLAQAADQVHLEVTTLVIPTKNDSDEEIAAIASFLAGLNPDIPLHLSAYYPTYRYTIEATSAERIFELVEVAAKYLRYVFPGNVGAHEATTRCPECNATLIRRAGYQVSMTGIDKGHCHSCGRRIAIAGLN
jgi:pyruvate formate lyase activating enzyme